MECWKEQPSLAGCSVMRRSRPPAWENAARGKVLPFDIRLESAMQRMLEDAAGPAV